jgi:hypothetical protein
MSDIGKRLRVGADNKPFSLTDKYESDLEKHNAKLKEAVELLAKFKKGYEDGIVSEKDFKQAQANVDFIRNDVPKREPKSDASGKTKLDRNALDGFSGEHAHAEAIMGLQRAQIEHTYAMAQPGTAERTGQDEQTLAAKQLEAARQRKEDLDKLSAQELASTLDTLNKKLALYTGDQAGHQKLIEAKVAAEDKYKAAVQKTTFDLETIQKQAADRVEAATQRRAANDLKAQQDAYEMSLKTLDFQVRAIEERTKHELKGRQFDAEMADQRLQFEMETGELSKAQYLRLKQEQYDKAYAFEKAALAEERDLIEAEFAAMLENAHDDKQRGQVMAARAKMLAPVNGQEQSVDQAYQKNSQGTQIGLQKDSLAKMNTVFAPFQSGFASAISNMIKGTQTFKQAWQSMSTGILSSWINSISQMASKWVTHLAQMAMQWVMHKLGILTVHVATNQAQVASDAMASAESRSISLSQHFHEVMLAAKTAAANAFASTSKIPYIGPILAPVAAVAAFAGVMAFSAESGAVLPNHNTVGFLHPEEMVLPKPISVGLQNLIASGGLSNAGSMMNQTQGGSLSSTALQMMRNNTAAAGDTHNWGGVNFTVHNHANDPVNGEKLFGMMQGEMRRRNLRMA